MKLAWITDPHLNFVEEAGTRKLCDQINEVGPEALLIAGDIAVAPTFERYLMLMETCLELPIYFVLGNHDFYIGNTKAVRERATTLSEKSTWLRWLGAQGAVRLTDRTSLVGHDGWGDARFGDQLHSPVRLNDFSHIEDLAYLGQEQLGDELRRLGDEAAAHFADVLPEALQQEEIVVLTHVPPFKEACWHDGQISGDDWLPYFSCKAVGDVLKQAMEKHPTKRMTVICGHTHSGGTAKILPNLVVYTGSAIYGSPALQELLVVP